MPTADMPPMAPRARVQIWVVVSLLVLAIALLSWIGVRGFLAKAELQSVVPLATSIQREILGGNPQAATRDLALLTAGARNAAKLTSDPIWRSVEWVPALGPNLTAFRQMASIVDEVAQDAIRPLVKASEVVNLAAFRPVDGAVELQPLLDAQPRLLAASATLSQAVEELDAINFSVTVAPIRAAGIELRSGVRSAASSVGAAHLAVQIIPAMLGAEGPRKYLLLFQNNAEVRASGGLPGAFAQIDTDDGRVTLARQSSAVGIVYDKPVLGLSRETRGIYSDLISTYMGDITLTPNFSISGALAQEMWKRQFGAEVDGVISVDPVALSYLLRATGPLTLSTGEVLTSDTAVQLLLADVYESYPEPSDQDAFFAGAASAVFHALVGGQAEPKALIAALAQAGDEKRILLWSAHESAQRLLAATTLAGGLPASSATVERFGVYLNDATGAKMGTYLDLQVALGEQTCRNDGRPYYAVDVTLTNTAPLDAASTLSESVTGRGAAGVAKGNIKTIVLVYGPHGAQNMAVVQNGVPVPYHPATDDGHPVSQIAVELAPQESSTSRFYLLGSSAVHGELEAWTTPVIGLNKPQGVSLTCREVEAHFAG